MYVHLQQAMLPFDFFVSASRDIYKIFGPLI